MKQRILAYFEQHPLAYVSGEQLSERLQCSRTAVWKHIQELKKQGYQFESSPRKGYRLLGKPDLLSAPAIIASLAGVSVFNQLRLYDALDSTQAEAHRLAEQGWDHGTLIVAEAQTAGRGRYGKYWHSPAGKGLWMSLLLRPDMPIAFASQMTLLTAVALCRTVRRSLQLEVGIKWPNDLLLEGKKISGILVESVGEDERVRYMVVGVGIDCNLAADDYPDGLRDIATSLRIALGQPVDRAVLLRDFIKEFDELYRLYLETGFQPIRTLWESLSITLGNRVRLSKGRESFEGVAESMDEHGALHVRLDDGTRERVFSGEIVS